ILVIADQADVAVGQRKRRHPVERTWGGQAIAHRLVDLADHPIGEACWQRQFGACVAEWTVATGPRSGDPVTRNSCTVDPGDQAGKRWGDQGSSSEGGRAAE